MERVVGPGLGLELVSNVNNIPKGSRLAVSTTLLASLISACMRATGQARSLVGALVEEERRLVAARAILGEWLGGSGGGWQDSGGIWPGLKLIEGELAEPGDVEYGTSRGRLLQPPFDPSISQCHVAPLPNALFERMFPQELSHRATVPATGRHRPSGRSETTGLLPIASRKKIFGGTR